MTPLDKAREALAAVEKALPDNVAVISTSQVGGSAICGATTEVKGKIAVDCVAEVYGLERAAAIVSAVNFVRADLPALIAALEEKEPAVTNGTLETRHYAPAADMARRICSYAIGNARANVYDAALNALTEAAAEHERLADRVAKLEGAVLGLLHSPDTATRAFARALLTPAEGAEDGR
jgi:hypothetical protein